MRLEFSSKTSQADQLMRTASAKQPGRKHNHLPSSRVNDKRKASSMKASKIKIHQIQLLKMRIAAYWRGEGETFPEIGKK